MATPPRPPRPPAPDAAATQALPTSPGTAVTPPDSQKRVWWQRGWVVITIAVVSLLIGIGIGIGAASKKTKAAPSAAAILAQENVRKEHLHEAAVQKAAQEHEAIVDQKREAAKQAAEHRAAVRAAEHAAEEHRREQAKEHEEAANKKAEETKTYTGTGGENIGTIHVPVASTLHWECPPCAGGSGGDNFQISNGASDEKTITVNTLDRTSGETQVGEGTYHEVVVNTEGEEWTIHITPNE